MNKYFEEMLERYNLAFDEKENMIAQNDVFNDYHSKWKGRAHKPVDSLSYAVALLQGGVMLDRADSIIKKVISLQDLRENSKTYGLWSWYLEESLDEMSPPDYNWADFCSVRLMMATVFGYPKEIVNEAIIAACECIIKRDVQPDYMNISVLGAFATLFAGQIYNDKQIFEYGKARLKKFYEFGKYSEYNSPTYIWILVTVLSNLKSRIEDIECKNIANELLDRAWGMIAEHFHPETMQWAGPLTRAYTSILRSGVSAGIMYAVFGIESGEMSDEDFYSNVKCPEKYKQFFIKTEGEREVINNFIGNTVAHTYITSKFAVGSFSKFDMWNQRRVLLAFWGDCDNVKYFNVRTLHNGYDYCAATFSSKQNKGHIDANITFETEGGDTHPGLDKIVDGKINATDFRVLFEFNDSNMCFLTINKAIFDNKIITPISTERGIELVLYSGEEKEIDFNLIGESIIEFVFDIK